ncbi:MAG: ATP-binding cassette domain-containing protein [Chitinophagales bacterium]
MISQTTPLQRFFKLIALERKEITAIYFYAIISGLIALSLPLGIQSIINLLFGGVISTSLIVLIGVVVLGVLANGWIQILQMQVNENIQRRIFTRYSLQFAYKLPRLDLAGVDDYYLPELVNRFFDTAALQKGISKVLLDFPGASVQIIFGIALLSFYNAAFLFFGIGLVVLIVLILRFTYPQGIKTSLEESNYKYEVGFWLEEVARTIKTIKFMGLTEFPLTKTDNLVSGYLDARKSHFDILKVQYWSFVAFKVIITAALLIVGTLLVFQQQLNLGQFIAAEIVILVLINSIEKLINSLDVVYDMLTSLEKVSKLLDKPQERTSGVSLESDSKGVAISAKDIWYNYNGPQHPWVLSGLNFEIKAGEKVCIFGSEGSGKSTLLKLFTGAYTTYKGQLLFDNYPLGDYNLESVRRQIGVYLASADLFSGTLNENLTMGNNHISREDILKVSADVGLLPFIQSLPTGLDTNIDSVGKKLPRNTVNKILVTRALLNRPRLLLLEDCWSTLELEEQDALIKHLTQKNNPYTLVAVTNDEAFARRCDRIMLLDEGKIIEFGPFDEVSKSPEFQKMFRRLSL